MPRLSISYKANFILCSRVNVVPNEYPGKDAKPSDNEALVLEF